MAETSGIFTSSGVAPGDRTYTAANIAAANNLLAWNVSGVVRGYLNSYAVTNPNSVTSTIDTGGAVKSGYWNILDASTTKTHSAVTAGSKRIDRIILRVDTVTARSMVLTVIEGSETTGTPTAPSITAATDVMIAQVLLDRAAGGAYTCTVTMERGCIPQVTATSEGTGITANLVGNVTGNVTGDVTGNATTVAGLTVASSTYTPTISTSSPGWGTITARPFMYHRIGSIVFVAGRIETSLITAAVGLVQFTLPISTTMTNEYDLEGTATVSPSNTGITTTWVKIKGYTPDSAQVSALVSADSASGASIQVSFAYRII